MYVYGKNQVTELLRSSPQKVEKIFIARKTHLPSELLRLLESINSPFIHVEKEKLDRLVGNDRHQGIIAVIREIEFVAPVDLVRFTLEKRGVLLVSHHIKDPQNLGNMIRSAEALGVTGVIIPAMKATGFTDTVTKSSSGAIFNIGMGVVKNINNFLREIKAQGIWIYVLERGGRCLYEAVYNFPMALIAGAEDEGVGESVKKIADEIVSIPMVGKVSSLNVASSTAIALSWIMHVKEER